jgi:hypothetical protein
MSNARNGWRISGSKLILTIAMVRAYRCFSKLQVSLRRKMAQCINQRHSLGLSDSGSDPVESWPNRWDDYTI